LLKVQVPEEDFHTSTTKDPFFLFPKETFSEKMQFFLKENLNNLMNHFHFKEPFVQWNISS